MNKRVVMIGIGGASCSGKTMLAKHLQRVLPGPPIILHQDDFAPREADVPYSLKHGVQDWDDPPTAVRWNDFRSALQHVRRTGRLPDSHQSHDHLNKQVAVEIEESARKRWEGQFRLLSDVVFVIVDGFIMFWDEEVVSQLDVRIFLRAPRGLLKRRREERQVYVMEDGVWTDPPNYFEQIVWPAYIKAHQHLFEGGDVDGKLCADLTMLAPEDGTITSAFKISCKCIADAVNA